MKPDIEQIPSPAGVLSPGKGDADTPSQAPALRRNFGFISILGFAFNVATSWENILVIFSIDLANGGPAGLIYGYVFVFLGSCAFSVVLAELASMAPTAGGQYHWVYLLAPRSSRKFASYITSWATIFGWQAGTAAAAYIVATLVQGIVVLTHPSYVPQAWHATLLSLASIAFAALVNTVFSYALPGLQTLLLVLHNLAFLAIMIPLLVLSPHKGSQLFDVFLNEGQFPTQGLSFMVGIVGAAVTLGGQDGAAHMSEEIRNPSRVLPWAIVGSILLNGALGLAMVFIILVCAGNDIVEVLGSPTGYPFLEIFVRGTGSTGGAAAMGSLISFLVLCALIPSIAAVSREYWSLARDRGVPVWGFWKKIDRRTRVPVNTVLLASVVAFLLTLINLGSTTAFNNIIALTVTCAQSSYMISASLLLWRRCRTGGIAHPKSKDDYKIAAEKESEDDDGSGTADPPLLWGPWYVPGVLGIVINVFAVVFLLVVVFFSLWPSQEPVGVRNMNYNVLITGGAVLFSVIYYFAQAKKEYRGPTIRVRLAVLD